MNKSELLTAVRDKLLSDDIIRNELTGDISCGKEGAAYTEQEANGLYLSYYMNGLNVSKGHFFDLLNSDQIDSFNPIIDYIDAVVYDGDDYIKQASDCILLDHPFKYKDEIFKKWLVGMMASCDDKARYYNPLMLILIGPVACGKTEFFRRMLPKELSGYLAQSDLADGKDSKELMCKKMVILNDELDHLNKKEAAHFRSFISTDEFTFRPPYGRVSVTRKRLATLCGTSNEINVITDPANNRRMIPLVVRGVDLDGYDKIDKGQMLKQAWDLYKGGEFDWNLTRKEIQYVQRVSVRHEYSTKERELIQQFYHDAEDEVLWAQWCTSSEVANHINAHLSKTMVFNVPIGKQLGMMGYQSKMERGVTRYFVAKRDVNSIEEINNITNQRENDEFERKKDVPF